MKRVISPSGIRTALITGLIMLVLTPAAALASSRSCSGDIWSPASVDRGSPYWVAAYGVEGGVSYSIRLEGTETVHYFSGNTGTGNFTLDLVVPADFPIGPAIVQMTIGSCGYSTPMTITVKLIVNPGITITIPPALTTTTAAPQATTTTAAPQVTTTTTTDPPSTTAAEPEESTTSVVAAAPTTTSSTSEAVANSASGATSTSLVTAAPNADSEGGQPWSAWITGGLVGLMLGGTGMLTLIRKGVLKV